MIISARHPASPFASLVYATPRQAHRTRTLLAGCATDRYQVAPRRRLIHFVNRWHSGGRPVIARRNQRGDALVDRFRHLERVRVHDCVAYRDTRIHQAVHCVGKNRFLEDGSGTLVKAVASSRSTQKQIRDAAAACGSGHSRGFLSKKVDRTCR